MTDTRRIPRIRTRSVHAADDDKYGYLGTILVDRNRVYVCGGTYHKPTLLVSDDGTHTWRELAHPPTPGLRSIHLHDGALYLVGEYGMLAVSLDSGLTWTQLVAGTTTCLFQLHRGPDRTWWIIGDDGVILRSADGVGWQALPNDDWETRLLEIVTLDDAVHILGYDGAIKRWTNGALVPLALEHDSALTALIETRAGTWLTIGDGGFVSRSLDRGASWESIETPTADDLEDILELANGLVIVGDEATVLFSDDDGKTWVTVPTELDGHLWALASAPTSGQSTAVIVTGDDGAIWVMDVSATETMEVTVEPADDDDDDDDDDGDEEGDDAEDAPPPATFASIEDASARWIGEGTTFIDGLNAYVRRVYDVGPNKAGHEPSETRRDMADYVLARLVELNAVGAHRRARILFPPAYEPFDYDGLGQSIQQLAYLPDGRRIARVGDAVYELTRDRVVPIDGIVAFAHSADRRWVAKLAGDGIAIHDGWDGPRVRHLPHTLPDLASAVVAPTGDAVLAYGDSGIHWITEAACRRLLPEGDDDRVNYPHAALSPNGRFIAMGTQDSAHLVIDRKTGRRHGFDPASSYPHFALFHPDRPEVLLNSVHGLYGSASLAVDVDALAGARKETSRVLDRRAWVYSAVGTPTGYILGDNGGYLWAIDFAGEQQWYCFLGSTITAMAQAPGKLLVGSYAGIIVELELGAATPDPRLLTNGPVLDTQRWLFWRGHGPMLW